MAITPNRKKKPSCHHNLADKPDSDSLDFGKPDEDKKTPPPPRKISKMILIMGLRQKSKVNKDIMHTK